MQRRSAELLLERRRVRPDLRHALTALAAGAWLALGAAAVADEAPTVPGTRTSEPPGWFARTLGEVHVGAGVGLQVRWPHVAGKLIPASVTWKEDRYEFFAGYFQDSQVGGYRIGGEPAHVAWAPQHRVFALSRRFNVVETAHWRAFVGIGVAYKDTRLCHSIDAANDRTVTLDYYEPVYHGCDKLNGSHLNYVPQAGVRYYNQQRSQGIELAFKHLSNAGLSSPNVGENFLALELIF
ncbi:MAG: acyloxyacyl hydrolase [Proteobacteria bacterium]|nr:acyloxyacyl hydrolase [Pseudomonadota bacterium]